MVDFETSITEGTPEWTLFQLRYTRDSYLYSTDKYVLSDFPITEEKRNVSEEIEKWNAAVSFPTLVLNNKEVILGFEVGRIVHFCEFRYSCHSNRKLTPRFVSSRCTSSQSGARSATGWEEVPFSKNRLWYRVPSLIPSGNGQLKPACLAFSKYSPTVLLDILQAPAMARSDNPASCFISPIGYLIILLLVSSLLLAPK